MVIFVMLCILSAYVHDSLHCMAFLPNSAIYALFLRLYIIVCFYSVSMVMQHSMGLSEQVFVGHK